MTTATVTVACPKCGSDAIRYEWKAIVSQDLLGFDGCRVLLDTYATKDISVDDGEPWYSCLGCGHEDTEPSTFKNDAA